MERVELRIGDDRFEADASGPADGPLVLLLHGFPQTTAAWEHLLPTLAEQGFRAVAPLQRGYSPGASTTDPAGFALARLASDVTGFADHLGAERFHVVGHDWGGMVAWKVAASHPARVISHTSVSTPHPRALLAAGFRSLQGLRSVYIAFFKAPWAPELLLGASSAAPLRWSLQRSGLPARLAAEYQRFMADRRRLAGALAWYRANGPRALTEIGPITVPTLFVWGARDPALGRAAAEGTQRWVTGRYRFVALEKAGHWIPEVWPEELGPLLLEHLAAT